MAKKKKTIDQLMKDTGKKITDKMEEAQKKKFITRLNARLKKFKGYALQSDYEDIKAKMDKISGASFTKSDTLSTKTSYEAARALRNLIPTKADYNEFVRNRQNTAFDTIIRVNHINALFDRLMNLYYANWNGLDKVLNGKITNLPKKDKEDIERLASLIGSEYRHGDESAFNNISEDVWDRLEELLEQALP